MDLIGDIAGMLADWDVGTVNGTAVNGAFDAANAPRLDMDGSAPQFSVASADVVAVKQGDPVVMTMVDGQARTDAYTVADVQPDGHGLTVLVLQKAA